MPRRGENIYKRKDGRWEGRYIKSHNENGAVYGYVYASTYNEVRKKQAFAMQHKGTDLKKTFSHKGKNSFKSYSASWLQSIKAQVKKSTLVKYENILWTYLLPEFGMRCISTITPEEITQYSTRLLSSGGQKGNGLSGKTVSDILVVLKKVLAYASENGGYPKIEVRTENVRKNQKNMRILSLEEQKKLTNYLQGHPSLVNTGILICLYTGIRIGELCALRWEDINFEEKYIHICKTMQRLQLDPAQANRINKDAGEDISKKETRKNNTKKKIKKEQELSGKKTQIIISPPKSNSSIRKVPIPKELYQILWDSKKAGDTYVLTGKCNLFIEPRTMENRFKSVMETCGIAHANFHSLRHTFATRCVELGFDLKSLSEILGHATVNITLNRYMHPSMELKKKNMELISNLFAVE